jgi:integrase
VVLYGQQRLLVRKEDIMAAISQLFEEFIQFSDLRDKSVEIYRRALDYWIKYVGDMDVKNVQHHHAEKFKSSLKIGSKVISRAASSANGDLAGFKSFFSWLHNNRKIDSNPLALVRRFKVEEVERPIYSPEEIASLINAANLEMKIAVLLGLCGFRRGEALNLTFAEIDWQDNTITIVSKPENKETWSWYIKNSKSIKVDVPEMLNSLLLEKQEKALLCPYVCLTEYQYKDNLAKREEGRIDRYCPWPGFNARLRDVQRKAKIPFRSFQDLRDTYATTLAMEMNIKEVQTLLRHSSPNTTIKYYIRIERDKLRRRATKIMENYVTQ